MAEVVDLHMCRRRTTVDINTGFISKLAGDDLDHLLKDPAALPAPVTLLRKDLLVEFDIRDAHGQALAVPPREEDVFAGLCVLVHCAKQTLGAKALAAAIERRLYEIAHAFPPDQDPYAPGEPVTWKVDQQWSKSDQDTWRRLLNADSFRSLLRLFTFNFILLARVPRNQGTLLVKYSFLAPIALRFSLGQRLAGRSIQWLIPVQLGEERSYHFMVKVPDGMELVGLDIRPARLRAWRDRWRARNHNRAGTVAPGQRKVWSQVGRIYTSKFPARADYSVIVRVQPEIESLAYSALVPSGLILAMLMAGNRWVHKLIEASAASGPDTAAGLLLVMPSLLVAYIFRQGEHAWVRSLLLYIRGLVGVSVVLPFAAAGSLLVFNDRADLVRDIFRGLLMAAQYLWLYLLAVATRLYMRTFMARFRRVRDEAARPIDIQIA